MALEFLTTLLINGCSYLLPIVGSESTAISIGSWCVGGGGASKPAPIYWIGLFSSVTVVLCVCFDALFDALFGVIIDTGIASLIGLSLNSYSAF